MDFGLQEKVFLVTAATSGFGLATAGMLLAEGACVVISFPTRHSVDKAAARLGQLDRTVGIVTDSADPAAADRLVTAALTRFGRLDGMLLSIGEPPTGSSTAVSDQRWRSSFESGFLSTVRLARTAAPILPAAGAIGGGQVAAARAAAQRQRAEQTAVRPGYRRRDARRRARAAGHPRQWDYRGPLRHA